MNLSNFADYPEANLQNFDIDLQNFYGEVLDDILKNEKSLKAFSDILSKKNSFHPYQFSFSSELHRTAYFFKYGPCYSSVIASHLLEMIKNSVSILSDAVEKGTINVCCLGSGPGSEVLAISKVFTLFQRWLWPVTKKTLLLNITYIDRNYKWKNTLESILRVLKRTESILDDSKLKINVHFVKADFTEKLTVDIKNILKEADMIMVTRFLSIAKIKIPRAELNRFTKDIAVAMKNNSTLFYFDIGITQQWKFLNHKFIPFTDIRCIYRPVIYQPFSMNMESVRKCVTLFWEKFRGNICQVACIANVCVWAKSDHFACKTYFTGKTRRMELENLQESVEGKAKSTKETIKKYYQKVQDVAPKKKFNQRNNFNCFCVHDLMHELFLTKPKSKMSIKSDFTEYSTYDKRSYLKSYY